MKLKRPALAADIYRLYRCLSVNGVGWEYPPFCHGPGRGNPLEKSRIAFQDRTGGNPSPQTGQGVPPRIGQGLP